MWGDCTDSSGNSVIMPLSQNAGGNEVDITKWGAKRINLCIYDVQQSIQEGIGNIVPFNISGATEPGSRP